jgi:hypothetical protein
MEKQGRRRLAIGFPSPKKFVKVLLSNFRLILVSQ